LQYRPPTGASAGTASAMRSTYAWLLGTNETMYLSSATSLINAQSRIVNSFPTLAALSG
jgi:hypothetical protein